MSQRLREWTQSDLIGVPVTIVAALTASLAAALFVIIGPLAGIVFGAVVVALALYVASASGDVDDIADIAPPTSRPTRQILVVANQALASATLESELARRAEEGPFKVRLIAPVLASTTARRISDDIDIEAAQAGDRMRGMLGRLSAREISASGHVDLEASPMGCLLDGLREFPADEVLLVPGDEMDWRDAENLAERIRAETGVLVTELDG